MVAFHDGQVIKLRADVHIDSLLLRTHSPETTEEFVRKELAKNLVKQIMDEDLIIIRHSLGPGIDVEQFSTELTVIQE